MFASIKKSKLKKKIQDKIWAARKLEEQILFGKVLETQKEKAERIKLKEDGIISKTTPSRLNSELKYIKPFSDLKVIKRPNEEMRTKIFNTRSNLKQKHNIRPLNIHNKNIVKSNLNLEEKKQCQHPLFSKIVAQKLLEFPIFEESKNLLDKWTSNSKIMSLSPMEDALGLKYPSVTKILSATMTEDAKAILEKWKMRMIKKLGLREFEIYQAELLQDGKLLHSAIMDTLYKKPIASSNRIKQSLISLTGVFENIDNVRALETHVIHPTLKYRGIVDCIASYRGDLCLIDWKKSDKEKYTITATYDAPFQLASYIGALNADLKYPFQIKKGLIVIAYTNGKTATVHEVGENNLQLYWKIWLKRLQNYHLNSSL